MHVFYYPGTAGISDKITLDREESQHCIKVLRHREGDEVFVANGLGERYAGRITKANVQACELQVLKIERTPSSHSIHLAIAPTRQAERTEWFVEKACELGVSHITFLECEHSVRTNIKRDRLEKITISALKQSKNFTKAQLHGPVRFNDFVRSVPEETTSFIAVAGQPLERHLLNLESGAGAMLLLIGPEGDFSNEEVKLAAELGIQAVSLGPSVLRTETAGVIGCHLLHLLHLRIEGMVK